jgi:prepilin-type N-terminal cleavage/methylation domain-containing protein
MRLARIAPRCTDQEGFTLVEVVVAMLLLAIGLLGAASAVSMQMTGGLGSAAATGLGAINRSNVISTATMLAQEKIEQLKHDAQWRGAGTSGSPLPLPYNPPAVTLSPLSASTSCAGTVSGSVCTETKVSNFATYSRTTTVTYDSSLPASGAKSRYVTVDVTYVAVGDVGTSFGGKVTLATIIAERP